MSHKDRGLGKGVETMGSYVTTNYFQPNASNTIDDITGFKKKSTEVVRDWQGFYGVPEAVSPRNKQDFAPTILETVTYKNTRFESNNPSEAAATPPEVI